MSVRFALERRCVLSCDGQGRAPLVVQNPFPLHLYIRAGGALEAMGRMLLMVSRRKI
jgi:hypothetical protein